VNATIARLTRLTAAAPPAGDGTLLDAFLAGDQEAFAVLVRRHAGLVFATCRRVLRHQQDAEDAFQATFLVLARRAADVWPREAVASWLFGVAHRVALKARAARNRRLTREQPLQEVVGLEPPPPEFDSAELVHRVIGKLPEVYRAAVVACDLEGLSRKEAAARLGWSEGTLSGRLARARELLANRLRRHGLSLPAWGLAAFAATESASAETVQTAIKLATGAAASAPPAVVALTEGVVRSMGVVKVKAMAAVVVAACALGWGAFAASGAGAGDQSGTEPAQSQGANNPPALASAKPAEPPKPKPAAKPTSDLDRLKGTWRVVGMSEGGKAIPFDRLKGPVDFGVVPLLSPQDGKATLVNLTEPVTFFFGDGTLQMPFLEEGKVWKRRPFSFGIDEKKAPREITLFAANRPVGRGIYEFTAPARACQSCHEAPNNPAFGGGLGRPSNEVLGLCGPAMEKRRFVWTDGLRLAISIDGKRPTKFGGPGVIVFDLCRAAAGPTPAAPKTPAEAQQKLALLAIEVERARIESDQANVGLREAEAQVEVARAHLAQAQAIVAMWSAKVEQARARLAAAQKAAADARKPKPTPAKEGEAFTVHVRPLTAAEKVIRVKATGKESVLEGLTYAAEDMAIKSDAVSVWVVRDKAVLPVDLAAIRKGDAKTNYSLKPGDQLFVQARPNP
jgi:RNA polymerase sigma factor (sigma-70 family)